MGVCFNTLLNARDSSYKVSDSAASCFWYGGVGRNLTARRIQSDNVMTLEWLSPRCGVPRKMMVFVLKRILPTEEDFSRSP